MELPKVLVVSINPWRDNTGINTLIGFFQCWEKKRIAQIYTKSALPDTEVCENFFRISENAVMKSLLRPGISTGQRVENQPSRAVAEGETAEQRLYGASRGGFSRILLSLCRELVWKLGRWKTRELDRFLEDFDPEVLFLPVYPTVYMGRIQRYMMKKTGKPAVCYLADDNYTYRAVGKHPLKLLHRYFLRKQVKALVTGSEKVLVIAPKQKEEYDRTFGVESQVLTKGIEVLPFKETELHRPIQMVYTGKLIIGRWNSLSAIAEALGEINKKETRIELSIYTTDTLSKEQARALNRNGSAVKGALTLDEVQRVQKEADILVFAESLEKKYKDTARLSFSTKITDYLKSGRCIFAIGDKEIAPMDYFCRYDAAVTATSYEEIQTKLTHLADHPEEIGVYARKGYDCGIEHHEKEKMDRLLTETICDARKK